VGLITAHLSDADRLAAGLRALPSSSQPFAATQAAWRFYDNPRITLPVLAAPLVEAARMGVQQTCKDWVLVALDWCLLHYNRHDSKVDRIVLAHTHDLGYKLLTALAISDQTGAPLAPVCLELGAQDGVHTTRQRQPGTVHSALDSLAPVMAHVEGLHLGRPAIYIIDREADSVQHYRRWSKAGRYFVVRANHAPRVLHAGREQPLGDVAKTVPLVRTGPVSFKGAAATQYVGETTVVLERPARTNRVTNGKKEHKNVPGPPITLRLIVSEIRDAAGRVLACWLLLTNLPAVVKAETIALWYYWRWNIESYHKLLKQAGQHLECWQQDDARQLSRRLSVVAMAAVLVWQLARDKRPEAAELREVLVSLSGRQMKRGKGQPGFTKPALLAGLGILLPMLSLLEKRSPAELRRLACQALPIAWLPIRKDSG
jgi:hypothetical protein